MLLYLARRIVEAEAEEAHLAAEREAIQAEEAHRLTELGALQQRETLEQQFEIARRKVAAESESKRVETEKALKIQV